ncbi:hypothetical protein HBI95_045750 [Parastagonospora nodorum]|nr:hypothetical protein HBI95_045750 [Parastagonospora nodorum]
MPLAYVPSLGSKAIENYASYLDYLALDCLPAGCLLFAQDAQGYRIVMYAERRCCEDMGDGTLCGEVLGATGALKTYLRGLKHGVSVADSSRFSGG